MEKKRVGILTSGGDCPGLNAVIRGAVKSCHQLGYDCIGFLKGYEGLYDPVQYVHLSPKSTMGILKQGGTILGSTNKGRFAATVGVQDRKELDPELVEGVKQTVEQLSLDGLICVGGDGSLAVAQQFHEQGIPVVGVPKTIDNDLSATAFTFGFDSAIDCATDALDRLHTTAASHERIMVLEVMGRHAGWIALHSGIAGGGDVILIPEVPWSFDHVCQKVLHRESQGKKFTLVVVAEGIELPGEGLVGDHVEGQQMKLGGAGRAVADGIEKRLHRETRLCVLGHLQRGGAPTTFDRVLATQFGAHAVRLVKEGRFGEMICSQPPEMTSVPIMEAVNVLRQVDPHGPAVQAARAMGISFGDRPADEIGQDVFDRPEEIENHAPIEVQAPAVHFEIGTDESDTREASVSGNRSEARIRESSAPVESRDAAPATEAAAERGIDLEIASARTEDEVLAEISEAVEELNDTVETVTVPEPRDETANEATRVPEQPEGPATQETAPDAAPVIEEAQGESVEEPALEESDAADSENLLSRQLQAALDEKLAEAHAPENEEGANSEGASEEPQGPDLDRMIQEKLAAAQRSGAAEDSDPTAKEEATVDPNSNARDALEALEEALAD